jgi:gliding motility-associated-like protein
MALDSIRVKLITPDVFVANIFSPNGDGRNDELIVMGAENNNFRFAVYDRWGSLIFESNNTLNGWNGTVRGKPANSGVYVFTYAFIDRAGNKVSGHGDVTVVQ